MKATVTLHLGAHKTASSHLQRTLRRQSAMIEAAGVALLLPRTLRNALPTPALCAGRLDEDTVAIGNARTELARLSGDAGHLLMSDENILGSAHGPALRKTGTFYPEAHMRLDRLLKGYGLEGVTLCLAIRDPAGFVVSAYSQRIFARGYTPFEKFLGGVDVCTLAWSELVERLCGVAGVARLCVWRYEDYPGNSRQVYRSLLPREPAASVVPTGDVRNPGLSADAHAVMAQLHANGELVDAARAGVLRQTLPKGGDRLGFSPLSPGLRAESATYYAEDVADIAKLDRVTLIAP